MVSNKEIVRHLTSQTVHAGLIDTLKIRYRPLICPFDKLLEYAEQASSVFDIGCGSGQFCSLVAQFTPVTTIRGVEISPRLIENCRQLSAAFSGSKQLEFEVFDGKVLPIALGQCDVVYLIDVIHHVPPPQQVDFLKEIFAKMKSGGVLVFKDIDRAHPFVFFNKLHDMVFSREIGNEIVYLQALELVKEIGFEVVEAFTKRIAVYPHYFIICKKL